MKIYQVYHGDVAYESRIKKDNAASHVEEICNTIDKNILQQMILTASMKKEILELLGISENVLLGKRSLVLKDYL
jgi:hypothetical protein